jgi:hypothetical protein
MLETNEKRYIEDVVNGIESAPGGIEMTVTMYEQGLK